MTAAEIINKYTKFFQERGHALTPNASIVPENDPTTLFTSSGMQPLVPYLLGEPHPLGNRLVNVQNSFRAQDIDEVGDNRHTTFFRMLGNWSLGDYFKKDQLPWLWEFLTKELGLSPKNLYVTVFAGDNVVPRDEESIQIWKELFKAEGMEAEVVDNVEEKGMGNGRIFSYGVKKNWWSRSGIPDNMPVGEPGGPDSEVFIDFGANHKIHENSQFAKEPCHPNCDCGRFFEIANSVFMQYKKTDSGFEELPQRNVDFGGGMERLLAAVDYTPDMFMTNLFRPIIERIEKNTNMSYSDNRKEMQIITDHFAGAVAITAAGIYPSNKDQGYMLRRLIRRSLDNYSALGGKNIEDIIEIVVKQYQETDPVFVEKYEHIKGVILEEEQAYSRALGSAKKTLETMVKERKRIDEDHIQITADEAFTIYSSHGLSPTQIKSLGYIFNDQEFAQKMKEHAQISRAGAEKKFKGGLADHEEKTIHGHTATHLLHKALRDKFGDQLFQRGSNITTERVRFDFNFDRKMTPEEIKEIEDVVNQKIQEDLPVYYRIIPLERARELGAIGLFGEKYEDTVKVYFIGGNVEKMDEYLNQSSSEEGAKELHNSSEKGNQGNTDVISTDKVSKEDLSISSEEGAKEDLSSSERSKPLEGVYSTEFCGGPHVENTGVIKSFKITKEEGLGKGIRRIYSVVE